MVRRVRFMRGGQMARWQFNLHSVPMFAGLELEQLARRHGAADLGVPRLEKGDSIRLPSWPSGRNAHAAPREARVANRARGRADHVS